MNQNTHRSEEKKVTADAIALQKVRPQRFQQPTQEFFDRW